MGHPGLQIPEGDLTPLLSADRLDELQQTYLNNLRKNISEYMSNSMSTDKKVSSCGGVVVLVATSACIRMINALIVLRC